MSAVMDFLTVFSQPQLLLLVGLGTFAGVYVGAIPGLSVTMAVSILISFTFSWDVYPAISLMIGIYMGGVYGGSRTAILLNIPGAPSAIATALDGYPMALRGEAGEAIGVTTVMSFIGGFIGIGVLALFAPLISDFALTFQPRDYMLLAILGILLVGSLSQGSLVKGIFAGALGIAIGAVGRDPLTFAERFTFDFQILEGGISFIAVMIGMFGVSEALAQLHHVDKDAVRQKISRIVPSLSTVKKHLPLSLQTSSIGVVIGALPGTGGDIAALMAYDHAKRVTKSPEREFGDGAMEGLVAPETANNAAVGGAFIPMMTLGIPGDAVTAIMIGALVALLVPVRQGRPAPWVVPAARFLSFLSAWSMVEVFVIGVIVSLVKIGHMATVILGISFWSYVAFAICFTATITSLDRVQLWERIEELTP